MISFLNNIYINGVLSSLNTPPVNDIILKCQSRIYSSTDGTTEYKIIFNYMFNNNLNRTFFVVLKKLKHNCEFIFLNAEFYNFQFY